MPFPESDCRYCVLKKNVPDALTIKNVFVTCIDNRGALSCYSVPEALGKRLVHNGVIQKSLRFVHRPSAKSQALYV